MNRFLLILGFLVLMVFEVLRVYLIMPMPGSQEFDSINLAYFLGRYKIIIRILLFAFIAYPFLVEFNLASKLKKMILVFLVLVYGSVFYLFNFEMEADKMFYQPVHKHFARADQNKIGYDKLIIGVESNGTAKAYPIQLIGYHHQVVDTVDGDPIMVTYCTVCRTGRVFHPEVNGKIESFRLVGMDHYNAMFEDATTKSWWAQATGECIAGPLKGYKLKEFPSEQSRLDTWLGKFPASMILQPDSTFKEEFDQMKSYDKGLSKGRLTKRDSASWKFKSWVVGIVHKNKAKTYDWNMLVHDRMIIDSIDGLPLVLVLEKDTVTFHAFSREQKNEILDFDLKGDTLVDLNTGSRWNMQGFCVEGKLKGAIMPMVSSYQEFLHSWEYFHPNAIRFRKIN